MSVVCTLSYTDTEDSVHKFSNFTLLSEKNWSGGGSSTVAIAAAAAAAATAAAATAAAAAAA